MYGDIFLNFIPAYWRNFMDATKIQILRVGSFVCMSNNLSTFVFTNDFALLLNVLFRWSVCNGMDRFVFKHNLFLHANDISIFITNIQSILHIEICIL